MFRFITTRLVKVGEHRKQSKIILAKLLFTYFTFRNREQMRGNVYFVLVSFPDQVFCLYLQPFFRNSNRKNAVSWGEV